MNDGITVGELADWVCRANHGEPIEQDLVIRRLRHWTLAGLLPTVGDAHGGTGRHNIYAPTAVLIAAVLNSLAENKLSIMLLTRVAETIRWYADGEELWDEQELWKAALEGKKTIYLGVFGSWQKYKTKLPIYLMQMYTGEQMQDVMATKHGGIWVNLTFVFGNLRSFRHVSTPG